MRKISVLLASVLFIISMSVSLIASAETEKTYTYSEIMAMTDEEFMEVSEYGSFYEFYGFENMTDDEKYSLVLGDDYYWYECFINGTEKPYFALTVDESIELDSTLTSQDLGFPEGWEIKLFTGCLLYTSPSPRD